MCRNSQAGMKCHEESLLFFALCFCYLFFFGSLFYFLYFFFDVFIFKFYCLYGYVQYLFYIFYKKNYICYFKDDIDEDVDDKDKEYD